MHGSVLENESPSTVRHETRVSIEYLSKDGWNKPFVDRDASIIASLQDVEGSDGTVEQAYFFCRHAIDGELYGHYESANVGTTALPCKGSACTCGQH